MDVEDETISRARWYNQRALDFISRVSRPGAVDPELVNFFYEYAKEFGALAKDAAQWRRSQDKVTKRRFEAFRVREDSESARRMEMRPLMADGSAVEISADGVVSMDMSSSRYVTVVYDEVIDGGPIIRTESDFNYQTRLRESEIALRKAVVEAERTARLKREAREAREAADRKLTPLQKRFDRVVQELHAEPKPLQLTSGGTT